MAVATKPDKTVNTPSAPAKAKAVNVTFRMVDLCRLVERYMTDADSKKVYDAFMLAAEAHDGVMRKSGEPYITHPLEVARILADLHLDADSLCAALLHDVIEDTDFTYQDIASQFGETVADLVEGVTKLSENGFKSKQEAGVASFQKMMQAMVKDYRVVLIKLADRLHNVRTLGSMPAHKQRRIAKETLEIHAPLARRMGMNQLRHDLQMHAFHSLYPRRSAVLDAWWQECLKSKQSSYNDIVSHIQNALDENSNIHYSSVFQWEKNLYRLYEKEKKHKTPIHFSRQDMTFDLRILTQSTLECYLVLGIVHQLFHPVAGSFKDFISNPKVYGFQALQTTVITPNQERVRIQIQSREMYQIAQYGIAAQWRFPYLDKQHNIDMSQRRLSNWLEQVKEIQDATGNPDEFMEDMKADFFLTEVSVMTPKGDQKILRSGATLIDFAYAIHTDVGHHCVGALVDGRKVLLNSQLHNGATVEIITDERATPRPSWLNFAVTGKARSAIRHWLHSRREDEFIVLGKQLLESELTSFNTSLEQINQKDKQALLDILEIQNEETLFREIGKGNQECKLVAQRLLGNSELEPSHTQRPFYIKGAKGLAVHLAECCHPIPDDKIVAHITPNNGLYVHRADCTRLKPVSTTHKMTVSWDPDVEKNSEGFLVPIEIQTKNEVGVLFGITQVLQRKNINIEDINIGGDRDRKALRILIRVKNKQELQHVEKLLHAQPTVTEVTRLFTLTSGKML